MTYWTYEIDGSIQDHEFTTRKEAEEWAQDDFDSQCHNEGERGCVSVPIVLIEFDLDDDGERLIKQRINSVLVYEYYRGDFAEHGTWHRGGAI